ncbi:MAG: radical SAM protein, partial [Gammaproteobacteria bacterium]|nr:radical SAM protein [Gammaproteobacteria bacterium]
MIDNDDPRPLAVLINPYELGRQPFALAELAAWLEADGYRVRCVDLALQRLASEPLQQARLIAISLGMHTATRIALEAIPRIQAQAPHARLCVFGLYAPVNAELFSGLGVHDIFGGEAEPLISELARSLRPGLPESTTERAPADANGARVNLAKIPFKRPVRDALPPLERYARLLLAEGEERTVAFTEASRGCKHLCRHCPVVPVYGGRFRIVPTEVVLADIEQQVEAGARHVSFGDPDFFNGPTHARRLVHALH